MINIFSVCFTQGYIFIGNCHVTYYKRVHCVCVQESHSGTSLDKMSMSTHSTSSTGEDNSGLLGMPHGKITKALSMSSIPAATNGDKHRGKLLGN